MRMIVLTIAATLALVVSTSAIDKNTNGWISSHVISLGNEPKCSLQDQRWGNC